MTMTDTTMSAWDWNFWKRMITGLCNRQERYFIARDIRADFQKILTKNVGAGLVVARHLSLPESPKGDNRALARTKIVNSKDSRINKTELQIQSIFLN